ncbi:MAG: histidine phosphatase family protein [Patescibacteria group bacterium]
MKRIYLVRHGESTANSKEIKQGPDEPLSTHGRAQARFLAHRVERLPIDIIIASPYVRTRQTAEIILEHLKRPIEWCTDIVEKDQPKELIGLSYNDPRSLEALRLIIENINNPDWRYSDEENFTEFRARGIRFLRHLEGRAEDHILVISHAAYIRLLLAILIFGEDVTHKQFGHLFVLMRNKNTGISVLDFDQEQKWIVQTWDDHAHLS